MLKSKTFRTSNNHWAYLDDEINKWLLENPTLEIVSNTLTGVQQDDRAAYIYVNIIYKEITNIDHQLNS